MPDAPPGVNAKGRTGDFGEPGTSGSGCVKRSPKKVPEAHATGSPAYFQYFCVTQRMAIGAVMNTSIQM